MKKVESTNQFCSTLASQGQSVMRLVPLSEGRCVNSDDGVLNQSFGSHQLVVGRVVNNIDDTRLARSALRSPGKVACIQPQSSVLLVASSRAYLFQRMQTKTKL